MAVRLIDFLALAPVAAGAPRVAAGATLLDREVRWAHVFETADLSDSLVGGEVLLTTGIALAGAGSHRTGAIVADATHQRATAIALELGSVHRAPPADLVEACDRNGLPLVVFEQPVRFVEITRLVAESRLAGEVGRLRAAVDTRTLLLAAFQRGLGSAGLVAALAGAVNAQVLLERGEGAVIARAPEHGLDEQFAGALEQWRARRPSPLLTHTVRAPGRAPARLHVLLQERSELNELAVEEAALALTVSLASEAEPDDLANGDRARLVRVVAEGRIGSTASLRHRARSAGVDLSRPGLWAVVLRGLRRVNAPASVSAPALVEVSGGRARMLVGADGDGEALQRELRLLVGDRDPAAVAAGVARRGDHPWELRSAFDDADRAALVAAATGGGVRDAAGLGPLGVVAGAILAGDVTAPVLPERDRPVLEALVDSGLSVAAAARRLGVSRQTLYARLQRSAARLGRDPLEAAGRADLVLAVTCDRMLRSVAEHGARW